MEIVYGVQGPSEKASALVLPAGSKAVRLSYDAPILPLSKGEAYIFAPGTTWGSGRNALAALIRSLYPGVEYIVMVDHDVVFLQGSFETFEAQLRETRPAIAFPLMPKAKGSPTLVDELPVQRAMALDEQMVAMHRSVFDMPGILPLVTTYDWSSWYVASYIFEYTCSLKLGPAVHQYNGIEVANNDHCWMAGENIAYHRGDPNQYHHLLIDALGQMYGIFDRIHIEQLDSDNEERRNERREKASIITTFDGRATGQRGLGLASAASVAP